MKPIIKHIIEAVCTLLVIAYVVFGLWQSHYAVAPVICSHLHVLVDDQQERQYISQDEIIQLIQGHGLSPVGQDCSHWSLQKIEDLVREHGLVRTAECYPTIEGDVCVRLTQRVPVVKISTGAETYYIDTDRKRMPVRSSVDAQVLLVCGRIGEHMASQDAAAFALWLQQQPYWQQRIARVEVCTPKMVHIIQKENNARIIMGDWKEFDQKLSKLRKWYDAGTSLNMVQYPVVDVRFKGQVVGIKEENIYANKKD